MILYLVEYGHNPAYPELFRIVDSIYLTQEEAEARREFLRPNFSMIIREMGIGDSTHHEVY